MDCEVTAVVMDSSSQLVFAGLENGNIRQWNLFEQVSRFVTLECITFYSTTMCIILIHVGLCNF